MIEGTLLQYMLTLSRGAAARQRGCHEARQRGSAAFMFSTVRRERKEGVYIYFKLLYIIIYNNYI